MIPTSITVGPALSAASDSTENALRESDQKFHQLADNISDVFWIRSPDMREVHYVSPAFEKIWGVPVETQFDNPQQWNDFILPEDREGGGQAVGPPTPAPPTHPPPDPIRPPARPGREIRRTNSSGSQESSRIFMT